MILVAGLAGLALRLVFGLAYWIDKPLTHDEREYLELARSLSAGRGFAYGPEHDVGTAQQFGRAIVSPLAAELGDLLEELTDSLLALLLVALAAF